MYITLLFLIQQKIQRTKATDAQENKDQMYDNEHREGKNEMMTVRDSNRNIDKRSKKRIHYRNEPKKPKHINHGNLMVCELSQ